MGSSLSQNATVQEVKAAVEALGSAYVKYGKAIADNGINGAMLRDITGEEIGDLGVTSLHKRRMLSEIEIFKANLPPAAGEPAQMSPAPPVAAPLPALDKEADADEVGRTEEEEEEEEEDEEFCRPPIAPKHTAAPAAAMDKLLGLQLGATETMAAEFVGQLYRYISLTKTSRKNAKDQQVREQIKTQQQQGQISDLLKRVKKSLLDGTKMADDEQKEYQRMLDVIAKEKGTPEDHTTEEPLEVTTFNVSSLSCAFVTCKHAHNTFQDISMLGDAGDMVHSLLMRARPGASASDAEWKLRRLWVAPVTATTATVASAVLGDTLMLCIAGSQPPSEKPLDWIINLDHSEGLYPATSELFPNLIFHQGMLADMTTFLSRYGSTAREDASGAAGDEDGIKGQSLDKIIARYDIKRVVFTGHSKGGGEAQILHMLLSQLLKRPSEDLDSLFRPVVEAFRGLERQCIVFASPMPFLIKDNTKLNENEKQLIQGFKESTTNYVCTMDLVPRLPGDVEWVRSAVPELKKFANRKASKILSNANFLDLFARGKQAVGSMVLQEAIGRVLEKLDSTLAPRSLETSHLDCYRHLCRIIPFKPSKSDAGVMGLIELPECSYEGYKAEPFDTGFAQAFQESWPTESHSVLPRRVTEIAQLETKELTEDATKALKAKFHTRVIVMGAMGGGKSSVINALCSRDVSHGQMCAGGVAEVSNRAIGVTKCAKSFVTGGGILVTDTMGTDDNDRPDETVPKMMADAKLLFRNANDGDVGYTHLILVVKQDRISNAGLRALTIVKNVLPADAWANVMLYNSHADDSTDVDKWFAQCKGLASSGDKNARALVEVKELLDTHNCPQLAGSLSFDKSAETDAMVQKARGQLREKTLAGLLKFVDTRKEPIPATDMSWEEWWATGGGTKLWQAFMATFAVLKAKQRYTGAVEFLQKALGMSQVAVTFGPCVVCRHAIHEEREANKAGARCPTCHTAITGHKELLDHFAQSSQKAKKDVDEKVENQSNKARVCTIIVSGFATPSWFSSDPNMNGEYAPVESKGVNGRGVWKKDDKCFLYYAQQQKEGDGRWHWWISAVKEDMEAGTPEGNAKVASEAMVPQHIEDTWQQRKNGWTDVNDVKVVTELKLISCGLTTLSASVAQFTALTLLDVSDNKIEAEGAKHIAGAISECKALETITFGDEHAVTMKADMTEADFSGNALGASGAIILATFLPKCHNNSIGTLCNSKWIDVDAHSFKQGDLIDYQGMQCQVTMATDDSYKVGAPFGALALADGIKNNGAMTKLNISNNGIGAIVGWTHHPGNGREYKYKHSDGRHQEHLPEGDELGKPEGVIAIANAIPTMGSLASVNILSNGIGAEQANALIKIMESKPNLTTLCGFSGGETELDLSKKGLTAGCAVLVANEIKNNRAMNSLDISNNSIGGCQDLHNQTFTTTPEGPLAIADAIKNNEALTSLNISNNDMFGMKDKTGIKAWAGVLKENKVLAQLNLAKNDIRASDAKILADGLSANGALTSLNLASNKIGAKGAKYVAEAVKVHGALSTLDISSNSIPNDQQANLKSICNRKNINLKL
eukprot:g282.t1